MKPISEQVSELSYPCEFPLRVIGRDEDDFTGFVAGLVSRHVPGLTHASFSQKYSRNGVYVSVSVTFVAESRAQLDALHEELGSHERVLYIL